MKPTTQCYNETVRQQHLTRQAALVRRLRIQAQLAKCLQTTFAILGACLLIGSITVIIVTYYSKYGNL